jgi:hypothetical protein
MFFGSLSSLFRAMPGPFRLAAGQARIENQARGLRRPVPVS